MLWLIVGVVTLLEWVFILHTEGFGGCINQKMNLLVMTPDYNMFSSFNSFDWLTGEAFSWKKNKCLAWTTLPHLCFSSEIPKINI